MFDITYEIFIQSGYTSHIQKIQLVPYYSKEPIIFPFIQQYNPHLNPQDEDNTFTNSNKETDIPSTIDFQTDSFNQYSPFPYQQNKQNN